MDKIMMNRLKQTKIAILGLCFVALILPRPARAVTRYCEGLASQIMKGFGEGTFDTPTNVGRTPRLENFDAPVDRARIKNGDAHFSNVRSPGGPPDNRAHHEDIFVKHVSTSEGKPQEALEIVVYQDYGAQQIYKFFTDKDCHLTSTTISVIDKDDLTPYARDVILNAKNCAAVSSSKLAKQIQGSLTDDSNFLSVQFNGNGKDNDLRNKKINDFVTFITENSDIAPEYMQMYKQVDS